MTVFINGSNGVTTPDGAAATPAVKGTTSSTSGISFPAADTVAISTASTERVRVDSSGNVTVTGTLAVNGTSAVAVAPGSSGNVLTSNGTNWTSAAPESLTLLATLTTTSGATQSATGLATTYTNFVVVCNGVQASSSAIIYVAASATNGSAYGADVSLYPSGTASAMYGRLEIYQVGASITNHPINRAPTNAVLANDAYVATDVSGAINALRFSTGAGTFSAGTILIYGWK